MEVMAAREGQVLLPGQPCFTPAAVAAVRQELMGLVVLAAAAMLD